MTESVSEIRTKLPFPVRGLDVDNDSAFINDTLVGYCRDNQIELTRCLIQRKWTCSGRRFGSRIPRQKMGSPRGPSLLRHLRHSRIRCNWRALGSGSFQVARPRATHQRTFKTACKTAWHATLRRAGVTYFRIYRLSAGGVADEWVTRLPRQSDARVFKKNSQMKLQMKHEALLKLKRHANEQVTSFDTVWSKEKRKWPVVSWKTVGSGLK